jgi:cytoskeletal protein RodZ
MLLMTPDPITDYIPMKLFKHIPDAVPLGPLLREARIARGLSVEQAARATRLPLHDLQALEGDHPLDPGRARIQAVSYARFLGLDPAGLRDSLPALPALAPQHQQFLSNVSVKPQLRSRSSLEMLAPMGRFALSLLLITSLLGVWGLVHQISRVRPIPGITSNMPVSDLIFR